MKLGSNNATNCASIDHIVPRGLGGSNHLNNLRITCVTCNKRKGSKEDPRRLNNDKIRISNLIKIDSGSVGHL